MNFLKDLLRFFATNKKLWLPPIIIIILLLGTLIAMDDGDDLPPFMYRVF